MLMSGGGHFGGVTTGVGDLVKSTLERVMGGEAAPMLMRVVGIGGIREQTIPYAASFQCMVGRGDVVKVVQA